MASYIIKRLVYSILTLYIVITITFFLMHAMPGSIFTGDKALPPTIVANLEAKYGLNKPLIQQYWTNLKNISRLDFGASMRDEGRTVNEIIADSFPKSAQLGGFSILLCLLIGVPLGIVSALKVDKWQDRTAMIIATLGVTVPSFVVATLTQYFVALKLGWLPVMGFSSFKHMILPGIALAFLPLAFVARLVRSSMLEVLSQDYIRTARAKGLPERTVIFKHALKNSLIPVITYVGPLIAGILTGSFVIEKIFNIPGLGRYFVESISNRDYTTMMGVTVFFAALLIIMNFIVDIVYTIIDPRIKLKH